MTTRNTYYSDRITTFKPGVIVSTKNAAKVMWGTHPLEAKIAICKVLVDKLCEHYGVTDRLPRFIFDPDESFYRSTGGGCYIPTTKSIVLYHKFSIVTLLHEFRHYMQHEHPDKIKQVDGGGEDDARAWSMSVFKHACPRSWERAVNEGSVHFV